MTARIVLDMTAGEALFALQAVTEAGVVAHRTRRFLLVTHAPSDEQAIADMSAAAYDRLELRLRNLLYPGCEWQDGCDRPVIEGSIYCAMHGKWSRGEHPTYAREHRV